MKYLCLLRGINVGGKNKVSMADLKACFEKAGFENVSTYINSGNLFFDSDNARDEKLVKQCEHIIERQFGFHVVVNVISIDELLEALQKAPAWWGENDRKEWRSDALFIIPPANATDVLREIKTKADVPDKFAVVGSVIFWSLPMADYNKSVVPKIIGTKIYKSITIRSSTTTKKLAELAKSASS